MAAPKPSIVDLAAQIQNGTATIQAFLSENSIPAPSFDASAFPFLSRDRPNWGRSISSSSSPGFGSAGNGSAGLRLSAPPSDFAGGFEAIPIDGSTTYQELASSTGLPELQLKRIIRQMMTHHFFHEPAPNTVAHTAGSKMLIPMRDTIGYIAEETFPGGPFVSDAAERFSNSEERNHTTWNLAHQIDRPIFEYLETDSKRMARFLGNMRVLGGSEGWNIKHLVRGYDWKGIGTGKVVDIGGNLGHACLAIAEVAPNLDFVVQDLEKAVAGAEEHMQKQGNVTANVKFQAHDFFTPEPEKDAEVYLLRFILHDYSDKYAAKILQNIVPAMGKKSRIVVMDGVIPEPGVATKLDERLMRAMDMEMMLAFNAIERDAEGWKAMFKKADPRLVLKNVITPPGSAQSVMEVVLKQD